MRRRQALLALSALGLAWRPERAAHAQPSSKVYVIGLFDGGRRVEWWTAFRDELRKLGYVEGQSVRFEERFANGKFDRLPALAQELVRLKRG